MSYHAGCFTGSVVDVSEVELRRRAIQAEKSRRLIEGDATPTLDPSEMDAAIEAAELDPAKAVDPYDRVMSAARALDPEGKRRLTVLELREASGLGSMAVKTVRQMARGRGEWLPGWDGGPSALYGTRAEVRHCPTCSRPCDRKDRCPKCDPEPIRDVLKRELTAMQTTARERPRPSPAFKNEWGTPRRPRQEDAPGPGPELGSPDPELLSPETRRVYDEFERRAPGGSGPVSYDEIREVLGLSKSGLQFHITKIRAAKLFKPRWTPSRHSTKRRAEPERAEPKPEPQPEPRREKSSAGTLTPAEQKALDYCNRGAPGGCRPVPLLELAQAIGVKGASAAHKVVTKLRKKGLWLPGWTGVRGHRARIGEVAAPALGPPVEDQADVGAQDDAPEVAEIEPAAAEPDAPPPDSPAARSLEAHATKHRITADERRLREANADRTTPVACEVRAAVETPTPSSWRTRAIELYRSVRRVLESLPDDEAQAWEVLRHVEKLMAGSLASTEDTR